MGHPYFIHYAISLAALAGLSGCAVEQSANENTPPEWLPAKGGGQFAQFESPIESAAVRCVEGDAGFTCLSVTLSYDLYTATVYDVANAPTNEPIQDARTGYVCTFLARMGLTQEIHSSLGVIEAETDPMMSYDSESSWGPKEVAQIISDNEIEPVLRPFSCHKLYEAISTTSLAALESHKFADFPDWLGVSN